MGGLEVIFLLVAAPFASLFAFGLLGWLFGAGIESIAHSKHIAGVAVLVAVNGVGFGGVELFLRASHPVPNDPIGGALHFLFIIVPSCIGFLIGGLNGMTR
jgi:hypothetical protein